MAYSLLPPIDNLSVCEWNELRSANEKLIDFCPRIGLLHVYPTELFLRNHNNRYLGDCASSNDNWKWRCRTCKSSRSVRDGTLFSQSGLTLQQIMDLVMYWSQGLDSHRSIKRNINILSDKTIVDWKNFIHALCVGHFIRHPTIIGSVDHVVKIDESAWIKRKYNRGDQVGTQ